MKKSEGNVVFNFRVYGQTCAAEGVGSRDSHRSVRTECLTPAERRPESESDFLSMTESMFALRKQNKSFCQLYCQWFGVRRRTTVVCE